MTKQEELFNQIINMQSTMKQLARFVQNDFSDMLKEGQVTEDDISQGVTDMCMEFSAAILDLRRLRKECKILMNTHIKNK